MLSFFFGTPFYFKHGIFDYYRSFEREKLCRAVLNLEELRLGIRDLTDPLISLTSNDVLRNW